MFPGRVPLAGEAAPEARRGHRRREPPVVGQASRSQNAQSPAHDVSGAMGGAGHRACGFPDACGPWCYGRRAVRPQLAREAWSTGAEVAGAPWQTRRPPPGWATAERIAANHRGSPGCSERPARPRGRSARGGRAVPAPSRRNGTSDHGRRGAGLLPRTDSVNRLL